MCVCVCVWISCILTLKLVFLGDDLEHGHGFLNHNTSNTNVSRIGGLNNCDLINPTVVVMVTGSLPVIVAPWKSALINFCSKFADP